MNNHAHMWSLVAVCGLPEQSCSLIEILSRSCLGHEVGWLTAIS